MQTALAVQSWTLYAVGVAVIFSRIIFRRMTFGCFKALQSDDWLMITILIPYTAAIVLANHTSNEPTLQNRKFRYVLEELQIVTIWLVKACLLILYWRIFPIETNVWKRRILQGVSALYCLSFLVVQISLIAWCEPMEGHWIITTTNSQCTTYHAHTATTLAFTIPTTLLIMMLPVPFIPTPRRLLLAILLLLGTLVLATGTIARAHILQTPTSHSYLHWYTAESSLSILFANLPFLTSLVVTTAPARIRQFSASHLAMSQWPRSRRCSAEMGPAAQKSRLPSIATTLGGMPSPVDSGKGGESIFGGYQTRYTERRSSGGSSGRATVISEVAPDVRVGGSGEAERRERESSDEQEGEASTCAERASMIAVPKMRLSGGLAEMGSISTHNAERWPIYWQ